MRPFALAAIILLAGCFTPALFVRQQSESYSPAMSSAVGLGLTPVFVAPAGSSVRYYWTCDFGYFVAWTPPAYKVATLGPEAVSDQGTLYWSYDPSQAGDRKPSVTIDIEAKDENDRVLARKTIHLDWERDTAHVRDN